MRMEMRTKERGMKMFDAVRRSRVFTVGEVSYVTVVDIGFTLSSVLAVAIIGRTLWTEINI